MRQDKGRTMILFIASVVFCSYASAFSPRLSIGSQINEPGATDSSKTGLRGVFLGKDTAYRDSAQTVGRIAVRVKKNGVYQQTRLDYRFRSGDKFQFEVSSNREGWLYIFQKSVKGEPELLWPQIDKNNRDVHPNENKIQPDQSYIIPAPPNVFEFDNEAGEEFFYVAITAQKGAPKLTAQGIQTPEKPEPATSMTAPMKSPTATKKNDNGITADARHEIVSKARTNQIFQIGVKGLGDPEGSLRSAIVYDPGQDDPDHYIYFSADSDDKEPLTIIEFQLKHEE